MTNLIKKTAGKFGIDSAIFFTVLSRLVQAGGGLVSIFFIANYLTKVEQGYYFTFGSILAIQIFFELGLSNIITQFVAHENAFLLWADNNSFTGSEESSSRLSSLLRFSIKWFIIVSLLLFFGLLITGYLFFTRFSNNDSSVQWEIPWIILCFTTSMTLITSPILAFFEGLGMVKEVAKLRLSQQIIQLFFLLTFFVLGLKLYSSPLASLISFIIIPIWILFGYRVKILKLIWSKLSSWKVNYKKEILPFQWRIALSWISGYFIFQLFNPVLFAKEGAIVAGQMGMTLSVLNGILAISVSWVNTKIPLFSNLIAKRNFEELDLVFNRTIKQSTAISSFILCCLIAGIFILNFFQFKVANRFLPIFYFVLLGFATIANQVISALAAYLRCHKKEPFLVLSVSMALLTATSTLILGNFFGLDGIVMGYFVLTTFVSLNWALYIFVTKKKLWHI